MKQTKNRLTTEIALGRLLDLACHKRGAFPKTTLEDILRDVTDIDALGYRIVFDAGFGHDPHEKKSIARH